MTKKYTGQDIQVLTDQEHVRKRVPVYLGSNEITPFQVPYFIDDKLTVTPVSFVPAVYKAIGEIIDNSLDEFAHLPNNKNKILSIEADTVTATYTVTDNGRGVPIDMHSTGKYTPEVVFGSLRSGRNFDDDKKEKSVIGTNGVGSSVTCFTSTNFEVTILRDHKKYHQKFTEGGQKVSKPKIVDKASDKTGTSVHFTLDPTVFRDVKIPEQMIHNRAIEIALCNPGVAVEYNSNTYKYKKGFETIIGKISDEYFEFTFENEQLSFQWFVIPNLHNNLDEQMFTWVNGSYLFDGGLCNTQFLNAFSDTLIDHLASQAKKMKIVVTKNDIRQGLTVIGNLRIKNPQFDSQAKTRLTGPSTRNEINTMLSSNWSSFTRRNKGWFEKILERAAHRHNIKSNDEAEKEIKKQSKQKIEGLRDATSKLRHNCRMFITEGLSAASQITEVRNPDTDAIFTLTGKINNVYGATVAQLMKMEKLVDLIAAIGLVPGKPAVRSNLRYGQIIIATDADVDGSDICCLLVNVFYQFWPELFDPKQPPFIARLTAPNVVASKANKRIHFPSLSTFRKEETKYKGWTIEYMKGLGSMVKQDWEQILSSLTDYLILFQDDSNMKDTMELLFGNDSNKRKQWLMENV